MAADFTFAWDGGDRSHSTAFMDTLVNDCTVSTERPHTGLYSLRLNTNNPAISAVATKTSSLTDAGRMSWWWNTTAWGAVAPDIFRIQQSGGLAVSTIKKTSAGSNTVSLELPGITAFDSGISLAVDTWYGFELSWEIISTSNWRWKLWIDGSLGVNVDSTATVTRIGAARFGFVASLVFGTDKKIYVDDVFGDGSNAMTALGRYRFPQFSSAITGVGPIF